MNYKVSAQTLFTIAFIVVACAILAVTNQVEAEEQKETAKMIIAHPADKVGIPYEEKVVEEAEVQNKTEGNILTDKQKVPEEVLLGPKHFEQWPDEEKKEAEAKTS